MSYAWCFSHGSLHHFERRGEPWCTATWTWLDGATEDEALADKISRYSGARFLHELPDDQQLQLILGPEEGS
ncbi:hypothetical protein [Streptomyces spectabilis]|uniref:Uncharacterized protein n=1 Tax=Streptomyces spectabilis TaxID=68270 RepID=A0A5P2X2F0_STRST|nr:hypothetical protein [Streptomyces spectabilis]MBB5108352.1 hypothetical protein [Streptomyces spectabilis]MCI3901109.1 hypothetical protein [Streptomyces spectabilis]QEV58601.1 hypothetical protein CP982_07620 [Streptomyces spectabilis]GGV46010.1 hypothetical protein GCM10010245_72140 [Streptomyces spectabilis]